MAMRHTGGGHLPYQFRPKRPRHDGPSNSRGSSGSHETGWGPWPQSSNRGDSQGQGGFQNGPSRQAPGQQYQNRGAQNPNLTEESMSTGRQVRASIQAKIHESQELIHSLSKLKDLFEETDGTARAAGISLDSLSNGNLLLGGLEHGGMGRERRGRDHAANRDQRGDPWEEDPNCWQGGSGQWDWDSGYSEGSGGGFWEGNGDNPHHWQMRPGRPDPDQGFGHQRQRPDRGGPHYRGFQRGRGGCGPDFGPRGFPNQGVRGLLGQGPPGFVGNRGLMGPHAFQRVPRFQAPCRPPGPMWRGPGPRRTPPLLPNFGRTKPAKPPSVGKKEEWPNKHLEKETPAKNKVPLKTAFRNLMKEVASVTKDGKVAVEQFDSAVYQPKVGLWVGSVIKKMKDPATNFWWHTCDIYINGIFICSGRDRQRSDVKKVAYNEVVKVFKIKSLRDIIDDKPITTFEEMKKKADSVETPFKLYDSNCSNVMIKRDTDDPIPISEFIMLEPQNVVSATSASETIATGILRQSADFTKMVLAYQTRPASDVGSICAIYLEDQFLGEAYGTNKPTAKKAASKIVLEKLQKTNYTLLLKKDGRKTIPALQDVLEDFGHPDLDTDEERQNYREKLAESFKKRFQESELTELAIPMAGVTQNEKFNIIGAAKECDLVAEVRVQIGADPNGKPLYERWYKKEDPKDKQFLVISRNPRGKELLDLLKKYGENHHYKLKYPTNEVKEDETAIKEEETAIKEEETAIKEDETAIKEDETAIKEEEVTMEEEAVMGEVGEQEGKEAGTINIEEGEMEEEGVMEQEDAMEEEGTMEEGGAMEEEGAMTDEEGAMEQEKEEGSNGLSME